MKTRVCYICGRKYCSCDPNVRRAVGGAFALLLSLFAAVASADSTDGAYTRMVQYIQSETNTVCTYQTRSAWYENPAWRLYYCDPNPLTWYKYAKIEALNGQPKAVFCVLEHCDNNGCFAERWLLCDDSQGYCVRLF